MKPLNILLATAISLSCFQAMAGDSITLGTFPIPSMVESPSKGLFIELTKEIAKRNHLDVVISVAPPKRTLIDFTGKQLDGYFPSADGQIGHTIERSQPFYYKKDFIFQRAPAIFKRIQDLAGKTVGLTAGYGYSEELIQAADVKFEYAQTDVLNIKKLALGRLDAFIIEEHSGQAAVKLSGEQGIAYDARFPIAVLDIYYAFQATPMGKKLARIFSDTIHQMQKDGSLGKILAGGH